MKSIEISKNIFLVILASIIGALILFPIVKNKVFPDNKECFKTENTGKDINLKYISYLEERIKTLEGISDSLHAVTVSQKKKIDYYFEFYRQNKNNEPFPYWEEGYKLIPDSTIKQRNFTTGFTVGTSKIGK